MDTEFVEKRLEGLNTFCKAVSKVYYLHYSGRLSLKFENKQIELEEYQAFIRSPNNDVEKVFRLLECC